MADLTHVGHNIRLARERFGINRAALAAQALLPTYIVTEVEAGHERRLWVLNLLAKALQVELSELLGPDPPEFGPKPLWCPMREAE